QLAVARGGAVGDGAKQLPHATLKRGAGGFQGEVERRAGAREVLGQLPAGSSEQFARGAAAVVLDPPHLLRRRRTVAARREKDPGQRGVRGREHQLAEGTGEARERSAHHKSLQSSRPAVPKDSQRNSLLRSLTGWFLTRTESRLGKNRFRYRLDSS